MTRHRRWALAALGGAVVAGTALAYTSMSLEDYVAAPAVADATFVLAWLLALGGTVLWRPRWQLVVTSVLPALLVLYVTTGAVANAQRPGLHVTRRAVTPGGFVVRLGWFYEGMADPGWEVRVRSGHGLLTRERVVWWGYLPAHEHADVALRVTGPRSVEVVVDGQPETVTF